MQFTGRVPGCRSRESGELGYVKMDEWMTEWRKLEFSTMWMAEIEKRRTEGKRDRKERKKKIGTGEREREREVDR